MNQYSIKNFIVTLINKCGKVKELLNVATKRLTIFHSHSGSPKNWKTSLHVLSGPAYCTVDAVAMTFNSPNTPT